MRIDVLTLFPDMFESVLGSSILKRAQDSGLVDIVLTNIRDFTSDKHRSVDDKPYGGGPGMVMMIEPIYNCLAKLKLRRAQASSNIVLLSPQGRKFNQTQARELSQLKKLTLICGRYEGVDQRVADNLIDNGKEASNSARYEDFPCEMLP